MEKIRVAVIGGGASGMAAAIAASRERAEVTLFEQNDRVGKKILVTGNGKCNLSNVDMGIEQYCGGGLDTVELLLAVFGTKETVEFFQSMGLMVKQKNGYLYPLSEQASTVLDTMRSELARSGVTVLTDKKAEGIERVPGGGYALRSGGKSYSFDRIVIACGGRAGSHTGSDGNGYRLAETLGHSIVPVVPALVQLRCGEDYMKSVAGVRTEARVSLYAGGESVAEEIGELQLTDYGISGIVVFQLSRTAAYALREGQKVEAYIDCLPGFGAEEYERVIAERMKLAEGRSIESFFTGMLNKKLMGLFMKLSGLKGDMPASKADPVRIRKVFDLCRCWKLIVVAANSFENAQICAGGVKMSELSGQLESLIHPGIYFTGEILDVDGKCGGYNLQWAWTSGFLAGTYAAKGREG